VAQPSLSPCAFPPARIDGRGRGHGGRGEREQQSTQSTSLSLSVSSRREESRWSPTRLALPSAGLFLPFSNLVGVRPASAAWDSSPLPELCIALGRHS